MTPSTYTAHSIFGGRASWGATFGGYANADGNGHGTHVAQWNCRWNPIWRHFDAPNTLTEASGKPSIVSLSLGGSASATFDNGIIPVIGAGIHVVVAAGNNNTDASGTRSCYSRYHHKCYYSLQVKDSLRTFALSLLVLPPSQAPSSTSLRPDSTSRVLGLEEPLYEQHQRNQHATPHVFCLVAYLIGRNGNQSPAAISRIF
ncbi:hypothetical protein ARMSODRAFT_1019560 [Armillaria solidipes]|uniref:Peptidase S8/S53 domain-containing protein n=1 Tax=Armillaria solidipes TaxID=1076256 RepID=A0A2H3BQT2_9AGAR|nr:hypothetical protein ARMSODRAFT_1019560 [Armillaria solidipes]